MKHSSVFPHLLSIFAIVGVVNKSDVSASQILNNDVTREAVEVLTTNHEEMCPESVVSQCVTVEREDHLETLKTRTFESTNNLVSYRAGAEYFNMCWACFSPDDVKEFCSALEHAKSTVKERIFLPLPTPCETNTISLFNEPSNDIYRLMCTDDMVSKCDVKEKVKNLNSRSSVTTGNLQSYENGAAFLNQCWTCLSESNLEDFCAALEHAKSTVKERVFLPTPHECENPAILRSKSIWNNQTVYIESTFNFDDSGMPLCLQAMNIRKNAKLRVKPCQNHTKQKWVFEDGFLFLSERPEFCVINKKGKVLKLGFCNDRNIALFFFDDTKGGVVALRKGSNRFYFGFPMTKLNGKVRLYTEESTNESLSLWKLSLV